MSATTSSTPRAASISTRAFGWAATIRRSRFRIRRRGTTNRKLNWIWLMVYAPTDPAGFTGTIKYDHVVAAKSYVGCLVAAASDTTPPTVSISAPLGGATVSNTVTVSAAAADNVGVVGVQFKLDGANLGAEDLVAPYSVSWNTATVTLTVTLSDTTPPAVSITAPAAGATVTGTITVSATATDNVGVAGVQFKLDGVNLGAEVTTAPYAVAWDTTAVTKTSHTLTA